MFVTRVVSPRRLWVVLLACVAALPAASCTRSQEPELALACQMRKCTCKPEREGLLPGGKEEEVLFRQNGDAYCPKGFVLRTVGN